MTEFQRYLAEEVAEDLADGLVSRREALRRLGLLGLGGAAAASLREASSSSTRWRMSRYSGFRACARSSTHWQTAWKSASSGTVAPGASRMSRASSRSVAARWRCASARMQGTVDGRLVRKMSASTPSKGTST